MFTLSYLNIHCERAIITGGFSLIITIVVTWSAVKWRHGGCSQCEWQILLYFKTLVIFFLNSTLSILFHLFIRVRLLTLGILLRWKRKFETMLTRKIFRIWTRSFNSPEGINMLKSVFGPTFWCFCFTFGLE